MDIDVQDLLSRYREDQPTNLGPLDQTRSPVAWATSFRQLREAEQVASLCLATHREAVLRLADRPDGARLLCPAPVPDGVRLTAVGRLAAGAEQRRFRPDTAVVLLERRGEGVKVVSISGTPSHGLEPWRAVGDDAVLQQLFGVAFHEDSREGELPDAWVVRDWIARSTEPERAVTAAALRRVDLADASRVTQAVQGAWCGAWLPPVADGLLPTWWEALAAAVEA